MEVGFGVSPLFSFAFLCRYSKWYDAVLRSDFGNQASRNRRSFWLRL